MPPRRPRLGPVAARRRPRENVRPSSRSQRRENLAVVHFSPPSRPRFSRVASSSAAWPLSLISASRPRRPRFAAAFLLTKTRQKVGFSWGFWDDRSGRIQADALSSNENLSIFLAKTLRKTRKYQGRPDGRSGKMSGAVWNFRNSKPNDPAICIKYYENTTHTGPGNRVRGSLATGQLKK